jgi:hypothetical protein
MKDPRHSINVQEPDEEVAFFQALAERAAATRAIIPR